MGFKSNAKKYKRTSHHPPVTELEIGISTFVLKGYFSATLLVVFMQNVNVLKIPYQFIFPNYVHILLVKSGNWEGSSWWPFVIKFIWGYEWWKMSATFPSTASWLSCQNQHSSHLAVVVFAELFHSQYLIHRRYLRFFPLTEHGEVCNFHM